MSASSREGRGRLAWQLVRFGASGLATAATDYGTFALLYGLGAHLVVATISSLTAGFIMSFLLNKKVVFRTGQAGAASSTRRQLLFYSLLVAFNMLFTYAFIAVMQHMGISAYIAKGLAIVAITSWSFVLYKKIIFRAKSEAPQ